MLKIILTRLQPQAEEILSEEQAGFRPGRSTTEQIFNLNILTQKYCQHQQHLYHVFIDYKKAFDRVWQDALWATMRKYNINPNLIKTIQCLYNSATSAMLLNGKIGNWFRTTIGVRQGCLLSPTLFNLFLELIMMEALENHESTVSIGGRTITDLRFADDIDGLAGTEEELRELIKRINETSMKFGMEISTDKTKVMTNNPQGFTQGIFIQDKELKQVRQFKYLGAEISDGSSKAEICSRIAQANKAMGKLQYIWSSNRITLKIKLKLIKTLINSIFIYGCESWTLNAKLEKRIKAFEMKCFRKVLNISWRDHVTNQEVLDRINMAVDLLASEDLLTTVKRRKLKWYGHVTRSTGLSKTILQGTVPGGRKPGRQRMAWKDNIED